MLAHCWDHVGTMLKPMRDLRWAYVRPCWARGNKYRQSSSSSMKLAANNACYHVVLLALFGNLSLDLFLHPARKLCIYLSRTASTYGAPHTLAGSCC